MQTSQQSDDARRRPRPSGFHVLHTRRRGLSPTPLGLEQRLLARARTAALLSGDRIIVGFSGGRDSSALAAAMRRLVSVIGLEPILVHIDHRLRDSSREEAMAVVALAETLGLE